MHVSMLLLAFSYKYYVPLCLLRTLTLQSCYRGCELPSFEMEIAFSDCFSELMLMVYVSNEHNLFLKKRAAFAVGLCQSAGGSG